MAHQWLHQNWRLGLAGLGIVGVVTTSLIAITSVSQAVETDAELAPGGLIAQTSDPLPPTKTVTLPVEGEPQSVTFQLYNDPDYPLVTYYPEDMTVENTCESDGCAVVFTDATVGAAMIFLFPADATTIDAVAPYVTGEAGLLADYGWSVTGEYTDSAYRHQPWVQKVITFQDPGFTVVGSAYLGEANGRAFAVVSFFPPEAGDGYAPRLGAIMAATQIR